LISALWGLPGAKPIPGGDVGAGRSRLSGMIAKKYQLKRSPLPPSMNQPPQWDAVAIYGVASALLAMLFVVCTEQEIVGTYVKSAALPRFQ